MSDGKLSSTIVELQIRGRVIGRVRLEHALAEEFRLDGEVPADWWGSGVVLSGAVFKPTTYATTDDGVPIWELASVGTVASDPPMIDTRSIAGRPVKRDGPARP